MATLAEIRAKLLEKEQRTGGNYQSDNAIYAFWNIPENSTATLRFLPDVDDTNTFFWKERQMIRLAFPGIKGQDESRNVTVKFLVWKCGGIRVLYMQKFVLGLKIQI